jgi:hypothetical protein
MFAPITIPLPLSSTQAAAFENRLGRFRRPSQKPNPP